jgi:hypothetical protein
MYENYAIGKVYLGDDLKLKLLAMEESKFISLMEE